MTVGYILRIRDNSPEQLNWLTLPSIITNTNARKKGLQPGKRYYFSVMPVLGGDNAEGTCMMIITVMVNDAIDDDLSVMIMMLLADDLWDCIICIRCRSKLELQSIVSTLSSLSAIIGDDELTSQTSYCQFIFSNRL
jgi:hypothetical protein